MTNFASVVADIRYFADILAEISEILIHGVSIIIYCNFFFEDVNIIYFFKGQKKDL